jgi:surface antigen-like variable number repeat protein
MKPAVFLLCLVVVAAAVTAEPSASDGRGNQRPRETQEYRIREVRFTGEPAFETDALKGVLEELKVRRWVPGIWTRRPPYDARALDAGLARLRSFYLSNGYFDARVGVADVTFDGREATITLHVQSGPQSRVRHVKTEELFNEHGKIVSGSNGEFPVDDLCKCLFDAKRVAEAHGRIDFAAELEVTEANGAAATERNWVDVTARVRTGSPYTVGRISFSGNYRINESTLRRAMVLQERALFDAGKLRRSLARLNRSGLVAPITVDDVEIHRNSAGLTADLTISVRERSRGQWWLSGPVAATGFTGSLQASISSRLPAWGRGVFEASTYYVTFSLIGLPNPLVRLLPFAPKSRLSPLMFLERPYLPGQAALSGFALSPKRPAQTLLTSYGATHLGRAVRTALGSDTSLPLTLLVPVQASHTNVGFLICEPPEARLQWLRRGGAYAADLALGAFRPF